MKWCMRLCREFLVIGFFAFQVLPDSDPLTERKHWNRVAWFAVGCEERRACGKRTVVLDDGRFS